MSDTLYIQTEENVEVHHPHVYLQDIAKLSCTNSKILNHLRVLPVANLDPDKTGRYVISVMDLINDIQLKEPDLDITHIGEPNFIITYQKEGTVNIVIRWCKVIFVCLATFFGAGFSIMTFNNDVDIPALFEQIYTQVTGQPTTGNTVLEISYSIGIGLGVLFFFNHFGRMKLTNDMAVKRICTAVMRDEQTVLPVSSLMVGEYGLSDLAISMPTVVGRDGVVCRVPVPLNDDEQHELTVSAKALKDIIDSVDFSC